MSDILLFYFSPLLSALQQEDPLVFQTIQNKLSYSLERTLQTAFLPSPPNSKNAKIEAKIREDRIKSTFSLQKNLENRLSEVSKQLEVLKESQIQKKKVVSTPQIDDSNNYQAFLEKLEAEKETILTKKAKIQRKLDKIEEKNQELFKNQEKLGKEQKHKEIEHRIEEKQRKLKEKREELIGKEADYKERLQERKLFEQMQKNYDDYQEKEAKYNEQELEKIKKFHKPISNRELLDFEAKFSSLLSEKEHLRAAKRAEYLAFIKDREEEIKQRFSSNIMKKMEDMRMEELKKTQQKELLLVNKSLKHKQFFQEVKKKHMPKVDNKKKLELELLRENNNHEDKNNFRYYMSEGNIEDTPKKDAYELGLEYLRKANQHKKKMKKEDKNDGNINKNISKSLINNNENTLEIDLNVNKNEIKNDNKSEITREKSEMNEELQTKSVEITRWKPSNYLKEVSEKFNLFKGPEYWRKIEKSQNLSNLEKLERLRQEAENMEKKAKMKEKVLRMQRKKEFDVKLEENNKDIDDLLLNSIQAKLRLLEN